MFGTMAAREAHNNEITDYIIFVRGNFNLDGTIASCVIRLDF